MLKTFFKGTPFAAVEKERSRSRAATEVDPAGNLFEFWSLVQSAASSGSWSRSRAA